MKSITVIETGALADGSVVYRRHCTKCGERGLWLKNLADVDRNAALHRRHVHPEKAAA